MLSSIFSTPAASTSFYGAAMPQEPIQRLVIIDAEVEGYAQLAAGVIADAAILCLDPNQESIAQITAALQEQPGITQLDIIAHGSPGTLYLGEGELSLSNLNEHGPAIASWFTQPGAELLIYGCNVAAGDAGEEFIRKLAAITGAKVAASSTKIGSSSQDGNWSLDIATADFEPQLALSAAVQASYAGTFDWFEAEKLLADATIKTIPGNDDESDTSEGDIDSFDQFGSAVAIYDGFAVVGVPANTDVVDPNTGTIVPGRDVGSVYIFTVDPNTGAWTRETQLVAEDPIASALFGASVDASSIGDSLYVAIGAPGAQNPSPFDPNVNESTGAAYVFERTAAGVWSQVQKISHTESDPPSGANSSRVGDQFGAAIGIDGNTIVVGSPNDNRPGTGQQTGAVYIFQTPDGATAWAQTNKISNPNPNPEAQGDRFGESVAIADGLIIAGSPNSDVPGGQVGGTVTGGAAYIFTSTNGVWDVNNAIGLTSSDTASSTGQQTPQAADGFGTSVDIVSGASGTYAIVGSPGNDIVVGDVGNQTTYADAGSAYVFAPQAGGGWTQVQQLTGSDGVLRAGDQFGISVGIDDGVAIVGAYTEEDNYDDPTFPNEDPNTRLPRPGVSYIYELNDAGNFWEQEDRITASDKINADSFGNAVDVYTSALGSSSAIVGANTKNLVLNENRDSVDLLGNPNGAANSGPDGFTDGNDFAVLDDGDQGPLVPDGADDISQSGAAYIYRSQPQVQSVTPNVFFVNDPLIAGTNPATTEDYLTLTVVYDQPMNIDVIPEITFPNALENPGSTTGSSPSFVRWDNNRTFIARYDLTDINVEQINIDVAVDRGVGVSGSPQVPALPPNAVVTDIFSIDTKNPTATIFGGYFDGVGLAQPVPTAVNKPFTFVASFDEVVTSPAFDFVNANITDFSFDGGGTGVFTVTPIAEGVVSVDLTSALDLRSNLSNIPATFSTIYDITPPEVSLSALDFDPAIARNSAFNVVATFNEDVIGFDASDLTITNGVLVPNSFGVISPRQYSFTVDPTGLGAILADVNVDINAGIATDIATNPNNAAPTFSIVYDGERPTATLTLGPTFSDPVEGPFAVNLVFSEDVGGVDASDFVVTNATITSVFGSGSSYQIDLLPVAEGPVTITTNEGAAFDAAGNVSTASGTVTVDYDPPVPVVTQIVPSIATLSDSSVGTVFTLSISYSSEMDQTVNPVITFPNPTEDASSTLTATTGTWIDDRTFVQNYTVTDANIDIADIDVAAADAQDIDGVVQVAANSVVSNVFSIEMLSPTVSLTADAATNTVTAIFSEPVSDFALDDIDVQFGTASNVQQISATTYGFEIAPTLPATDPVEITILAGGALDLSGNPSDVSETLILDDVNDAPVITPPTAAQSVNGDKVLRFSSADGNSIQIADLDAGNQLIEVTLTATQGLVTLTNTSGLAFTSGDGFADGILAFQGSLSDVNAALEDLRFKPVNITGNASLQIEVDDLGNTGSGGAQQATPETIDIAVTKVAENDFNGDGLSDILLRNAVSGDNLVRFMNGTSVIADGNLGRPIPDTNWRFERSGDFNNDGKADIILRNYNGSGQNLIWFMDGSTILGEELAGRLIPDPAWEIEGTGDFNSDGQTDIILKNYNSDQNLIWYMNGSEIIEEGLFGRDLGDLSWRIQGTSDFNGDGQTDILLRHLNPDGLGQNLVWFMNGSEIIGEAEIGRRVPDINWEIAGAADFNGDGQSDILLRNYSSGQNLLWEMNGTSIAAETFILDVADTNWRATV